MTYGSLVTLTVNCVTLNLLLTLKMKGATLPCQELLRLNVAKHA